MISVRRSPHRCHCNTQGHREQRRLANREARYARLGRTIQPDHGKRHTGSLNDTILTPGAGITWLALISGVGSWKF